jgi:predicted outer membrane repeat protein
MPNTTLCSCFLLVLIAGGDGGAMLVDSQQTTITDTVYSQNTAQGSGGAIRVNAGNITISNSLLTENHADGSKFGAGGAVFLLEGCNSTFINTTLSHNSAAGGAGGAINTRSDTYIIGCTFDNNTATFGGAIRYSTTGTVALDQTIFTNNIATTAGGAMQSSMHAKAAVLSDTVVFSKNTAFCCYAKTSAVHSTTANSTCVDIAYQDTPISECCVKNFYSDGEHCQLCTKKLTCTGIVGANSSTVAVANGLWRASITSSKTYSCWNSDACTGGVAAASTDDYCAKGYKGPCKCLC